MESEKETTNWKTNTGILCSLLPYNGFPFCSITGADITFLFGYGMSMMAPVQYEPSSGR